MTEIYTTLPPVQGIVRKIDRDAHDLDLDDRLFYADLKHKMNGLLLQPKVGSIRKITTYSKALRTPSL